MSDSIREQVSRALSTPAGPQKTKSGEHPAVQAYRDKLESIAQHADEDFDKLAKEIEECDTLPPPPSHPSHPG